MGRVVAHRAQRPVELGEPLGVELLAGRRVAPAHDVAVALVRRQPGRGELVAQAEALEPARQLCCERGLDVGHLGHGATTCWPCAPATRSWRGRWRRARPCGCGRRLGRDLDALVLAAELQALLEREPLRRDQLLEVVGGGGPDVGLLLLLGDVDVHVVGAGVLADDHALVDLGGGLDEEHAALLQRRHGVRRRRTGAVGDQRAVVARADLAGPRVVALGDVVGDAGAAGLGEELGAEADQAARGDDEVHPDPAGAVVGHALHAALAGREELGDRAEVLLGGVDGEPLEGLVHLAVDLAGDDLRLADGELEALAAHLLDEDRQRQLAAALDLPGVGTLGRQDAQRHVADELGVEAVLDQAGGDLGALDLADQRRGVGADGHRDGRARRRGSAAARPGSPRRRGSRRW